MEENQGETKRTGYTTKMKWASEPSHLTRTWRLEEKCPTMRTATQPLPRSRFDPHLPKFMEAGHRICNRVLQFARLTRAEFWSRHRLKASPAGPSVFSRQAWGTPTEFGENTEKPGARRHWPTFPHKAQSYRVASWPVEARTVPPGPPVRRDATFSPGRLAHALHVAATKQTLFSHADNIVHWSWVMNNST